MKYLERTLGVASRLPWIVAVLILVAGCNRPSQRDPALTDGPSPPTASDNAVPEPTGTGLLYECWRGVKGSKISDLTSHPDFPGKPTERRVVLSAGLPEKMGDFYGIRLRGWIKPTKTGAYRFLIAADDAGEIWLSPSADPDTKDRVCFTPEWANNFDKHPEQSSKPLRLLAGKRYYLEVLMKQSGGGEGLQAAWEGPEMARQIIPAAYLIPFPSEAGALPNK